MDDQKKICITEEELLEAMVEERLDEKRMQNLKMLPSIVWIIGLVPAAIVFGSILADNDEGLILSGIVLTVLGVAVPYLSKIALDAMLENEHKKEKQK